MTILVSVGFPKEALRLCGRGRVLRRMIECQGCAVTRSFGQPVTTLAGMLEAVAAYATRAGE